MRRVRSSAALLVVVMSVGCAASLQGRMENAHFENCDVIVDQYGSIKGDPGYATEREGARIAYEGLVAGCFLEKRRPEKALEIATAWKDDDPSGLRPMIIARADAALGKDEDARRTLEGLARHATTMEYLLETPEFKGYSGADWFLAVITDVWSKVQDPPLEELMRRLSARAGVRMLSLQVATADVSRDPGEWVLWTGISLDSKIDRDASRTIVVAEGADLKDQLQFVNKVDTTYERVRANEVRTTEHASERTYKGQFVPNGRKFVITYPRVSEHLAQMRVITALGKFAGRSPSEGLPMVAATLVLEPHPKEHVQREE